jgi:DNA-binding MarR family transcriptional regulator
VVVGNDPRDRRARALRLTEDGRRALAEALPLWRTAQAAAAGQLASVDIDRLRASLRALA